MSNDLTPKYKIGDVVWVATVESTTAELDCPDCLGTREWKVATPAGGELTAPCMRCSSGYHDNKLPSLKYRKWVGKAARRPITGFSVNAYGGGKVEYSSSQGGGSSWIIHPGDEFETEKAAQDAAEAKAAAENDKEAAKPQHIHAVRLSTLSINDARFDEFKNGLWNAWYAARRLGADVRERLDDENLSPSDLRESMEEALDFDTRYRTPEPLESAVRAAEALVAGGGTQAELAAALAKLPPPMRSALKADTLQDWAA